MTAISDPRASPAQAINHLIRIEGGILDDAFLAGPAAGTSTAGDS